VLKHHLIASVPTFQFNIFLGVNLPLALLIKWPLVVALLWPTQLCCTLSFADNIM